MKQPFLLGVMAALIGMLVALGAYDHFIVAPRQQASAIRMQMDLADAQRQALTIADGTKASVERSVSDARRAMDEQAREMEIRRLAQDALARTGMFKSTLAEYHASTGGWPTNAAAAGLPDSAQAAGGAVRAIHLERGGVVRLDMAPPFATGSMLVLTPTASDTGMPITWSCTAQGDTALLRHLPQCQ